MASATVRDAALKAALALDGYALAPGESTWSAAREALLLLAMAFGAGSTGRRDAMRQAAAVAPRAGLAKEWAEEWRRST
jgi:hypothetical protein